LLPALSGTKAVLGWAALDTETLVVIYQARFEVLTRVLMKIKVV
jgi:hypothetical protein